VNGGNLRGRIEIMRLISLSKTCKLSICLQENCSTLLILIDGSFHAFVVNISNKAAAEYSSTNTELSMSCSTTTEKALLEFVDILRRLLLHTEKLKNGASAILTSR